MDPVGQSRPIPTPDPGSRPIEFLLRLLDLSKGSLAGASVAATFAPSVLERALSSEGAGPLRFLPLPPPLNRPLLRVLSAPDLSAGAPRIAVSVTRHENGLEWSFSGRDLLAKFRSDLLLSRTGGIALRAQEDPALLLSPAGSPDGKSPLSAPDTWIAGTLSPLAGESGGEDRVSGAGVLRAAAGAGGARGSGPVMAWPAYIPGQTIEFAVRWLPPEETEGDSRAPGRPGGGGVVFTLDIPWEEPEGKGLRKSVRLLGRFLEGGSVELSAPALPDSFRRHLLARRDILEESLRIFPGVALRLHLPGTAEGMKG